MPYPAIGISNRRAGDPSVADTETVPDRSSDAAAADAFIARWQGVTASELSTSQSYLIDLCRLLAVDTPHPTAELPRQSAREHRRPLQP